VLHRGHIMQLLSSFSKHSSCIHFEQSADVHCTHSCNRLPSQRSSSYAPKQTAHSFIEISWFWMPSEDFSSLAFLEVVPLALFCFNLSSLSLAFCCFNASFSAAFFSRSAAFLALSSAFFFFSSSRCALFNSRSCFLFSLASSSSLFFLYFSSIIASDCALVRTLALFGVFCLLLPGRGVLLIGLGLYPG